MDVANAEINELQSDILDVKSEMGGVKIELEGVKSDMGDVKALVASSSGSMTEEDLQRALQQSQSQRKDTDLRPLESRVANLEKIDVDGLLKKMKEIEETASSMSSSSSSDLLLVQLL